MDLIPKDCLPDFSYSRGLFILTILISYGLSSKCWCYSWWLPSFNSYSWGLSFLTILIPQLCSSQMLMLILILCLEIEIINSETMVTGLANYAFSYFKLVLPFQCSNFCLGFIRFLLTGLKVLCWIIFGQQTRNIWVTNIFCYLIKMFIAVEN